MKRTKERLPVERYHLEPQTGVAFTVPRDQGIRVIDVDLALSIFL